jgi:ATP-dependent Clp protease ATP-binding subunit ClpA
MFERFHHDARAVVAHARDEATRSGKNEIGTGDLLLGLMAEPGDAADALQAAGAEAADLRATIRRGHAAGSEPSGTDEPGGDAAGGDAPVLASVDEEPAQRAAAPALGSGSPDQDGAGQDGAGQDGTAQDGTAQDGTGRDGASPAGWHGLTGGLRLTGDARRAVDFAARTAHRFKHQHVSSGHLLLGLIDQSETSATEALTVAGIHVGTLRTDVLRRMEAGLDPGLREPGLRHPARTDLGQD